MENYYKILQVDKVASDAEVKRAFYKLVKVYSPEKNPEEYKKIRQAYEVLKEVKLRNDYDQLFLDDDKLTNIYFSALDDIENYNTKDAIAKLRSLIKKLPENISLRESLFDSYIVGRKKALAIRTKQQLIEIEPQNEKHYIDIIEVYITFSDKKNGTAFCESIVEKFMYNEYFWSAYIKFNMYLYDDYKTIFLRAENIKAGMFKNEYENYVGYLINNSYNEKGEKNNIIYLKYFLKYFILDSSPDEQNIENAIGISFEYLDNKSLTRYISDAINKINSIGFVNEQFNTLKLYFFMPHVMRDKRIHHLVGEFIVMMLNLKLTGENCFEDFNEMSYNDIDDLKLLILNNRSKCIKSVTILKQFYLEFYNLGKSFFDCLIDEVQSINLKNKMMPISSNINNGLPLVTKKEKISRNDTCPCGSGKKYKHCCLK